MYKKVDNSQWMYITSIYHKRFSPFIAVSVSGQNIYESSWNSVPDQTAPSVTPTPIHPCRWCLTLSQTSPGFYVSAVHLFRKNSGKRRKCS